MSSSVFRICQTKPLVVNFKAGPRETLHLSFTLIWGDRVWTEPWAQAAMLVGVFEVPSSPASHTVTRLECRLWLDGWRHAALVLWPVPVTTAQTASTAVFSSDPVLPSCYLLRCRNQSTEQETFRFLFPIFVLLKLRFLGLPTKASFLCHGEII